MIKLILPGSIRSKKNSKRIFKRGRFTAVLPSKAYEVWEEEARISAKLQLFHFDSPYINLYLPLKGSIHVQVRSFYKGRRPDLSGMLESVGDCLEGIAWENDSQIESWDGSRLIHDKYEPRTEIEIRKYIMSKMDLTMDLKRALTYRGT